MTSDKRWNIQTDLPYVETFYERQSDGSFVETAIPSAEIDFSIEYYTDGASRFTASRINGVYNGCKPIDGYSIEVFIPLSRKSMGKGELLRKLILTIPDNNFLDQVRNTCIPAKTGLFLWNGPTDNFPQSPHGEAIVATIINASYDVIDITSSTYRDTSRKIIEKFEKGIAANIYIKETATSLQHAVIQVQKVDGGYRLFTGIFETSKEDGAIKTYQVYYMINQSDGSVTRNRYQRLPAMASADDYVKKSDRVVINGGSPADLI